MEEFEDKLNHILGDPKAMEQIMALAHSLGGGGEAPEKVSDPLPEEGKEMHPCSGAGGLGELDPRLLQIGMRLLREYQREDDQRTALLTALRPFVRAKRYSGLDKAIQAVRYSRIIRAALEELGKERERNV